MELIQKTRAEVLETGVIFESSINQILCFILDVNITNSIAFGNKSSLSFKQKVDILTDLKFVPKEIANNFQTFSEIRNKFAHVYYVDSFVKHFEILKDKKGNLLKFYIQNNEKAKEKNTEKIDEEIILGMCFKFLCFQLSTWMSLILEKTHFNKSQLLKKTILVEIIRDLNSRNKIISDDQQISEQIDKLVNEIIQENWFLESVNEAIDFGKKSQNKL